MEPHPTADQNVWSVQSVVKQQLVSSSSAEIHVLVYVDSMLSVESPITTPSVLVMWDMKEILSLAAQKYQVI